MDRRVVFTLLALAGSACRPDPRPPRPPEGVRDPSTIGDAAALREYLGRGGWTPMASNEIVHPGRVLHKDAGGRTTYFGELVSCSPSSVSWPAPADSPVAIPNGLTTVDLDADAITDFLRIVRLGPSFGRVKTVRVTFDRLRQYRLDMIAVGRTFADQPDAIPHNCLSQVFVKDAEVVSESLVLQEFTLELLDARGGRIPILEDSSPYFFLAAESGTQRMASGVLESSAAVTLGVRTVPAAKVYQGGAAAPGTTASSG